MQFRELDDRVPFARQLGESESPIVFFNTFHVAPEEVDAFLDAWRVDGEFMQRQPGYVSTQLHRGIGGSTTFINVAVWESVDAMRAAVTSPEFQNSLANYPPSSVASRTSSRSSRWTGSAVTDTTLQGSRATAGRTAGAEVSRRLAAAGAVYVVAWIVGLFVAPTAPGQTASDADVQAFFSAHQAATLVQALLVHAVAGVALGVFVVSLAGAVGPAAGAGVRRLFLAAGLGAAAVSLVQFGLELALNRHVAGDGGPGGTASLFHAVNVADTLKLILLGIAIAAATRMAAAAGVLPVWLRALGLALLPILVIGGLAFVIDSAALSAVLTVSLFLLLLWVAAVSVVMARAASRPSSGAPPG